MPKKVWLGSLEGRENLGDLNVLFLLHVVDHIAQPITRAT